MYAAALILLFAKCTFVEPTNIQFFVGSTSQTSSTLEQILADLKQNRQQLENLEQANRQQLQILEQANRQQLQILEQANRQQLQILEQATKQQLQNLEETNKQQLKNLQEESEYQFKNLEKQISEIKSTPQKPRDDSHTEQMPKNCKEILEGGDNLTGAYYIRPVSSPATFLVFCDMESNGGGWTYLLNRYAGNQDFDLNWDEYKQGFGKLASDFWLGLENLYHLTAFQENELLIKMVDTNYNETRAHYSFFSIKNEAQGYALKEIRGYSGDAKDHMSTLVDMKFSTKDRDQDLNPAGNCASDFHGGWWYGSDCSSSRLTGFYFSYNGMYWEDGHLLAEVRMMVRPRSTK